VRDRKRTGGTITLKNHFDGWKNANMTLGAVHDWQIMAIEGYYSSGKADITVYKD
jgi:endo-1,4-beta-xylanase